MALPLKVRLCFRIYTTAPIVRIPRKNSAEPTAIPVCLILLEFLFLSVVPEKPEETANITGQFDHFSSNYN